MACGLLAMAMFQAGAARADSAIRDVERACPPPPGQGWMAGGHAGALQAIGCQWAERKLLVVGETHGTAEIPRFVGDLVERAARRHAVVLGLERGTDEDAVLARYLDSPGTSADRARFLAGHAWSKDLSDGRSSEAMFGLIERVRRLRAQGRKVDVFLMDQVPKDMSVLKGPGAAQRYVEISMAETVLGQATGEPGRLVVVLVGSYHARVAPVSEGTGATSLSWTLRQARPLILLASGDGSAWNCQANSCAPHKTVSTDDAELMGSEADRQRLPGVEVAGLTFPVLSSSPPAVPH